MHSPQHLHSAARQLPWDQIQRQAQAVFKANPNFLHEFGQALADIPNNTTGSRGFCVPAAIFPASGQKHGQLAANISAAP